MKKSLFLLAMFALVSGAFAQDNAAKLALAREVISTIKSDKMFDDMAVQMKQMATQLSVPPPGATPEQLEKLEVMRDKMMDLSMTEAKEMIAKMDQIYADVYSEAELNAMKVFFTSPEGQSMLAKQPQIMAQLMPLVRDMQRKLTQTVQQLAEEAKATK